MPVPRLVRAILIGAATVFAAKRPHEHWSVPPTAAVVTEPRRSGGGSGAPPR